MTPLEKAIEQFDLEAYIHENFNVKAAHGDELRIDCFAPRGCAGSEKDKKLYVNTEDKRWICFRCGYGTQSQLGTSSLLRFLADAEGTHPLIIRSRLLGMAQVTPEKEFAEIIQNMFETPVLPPEPNPTYIKFPANFYSLDEAFIKNSPVVTPFIKYLQSRMVHPQNLAQGLTVSSRFLWENDVRFCTDRGNTPWLGRIIFPLYDLEGRLRSATGRLISVNKYSPKWMHWPNSDMNSLLWPLGTWDVVAWVPYKHEQVPVMLVEGIFDAAAAKYASPIPAFCTFGKKISLGQIKLLKTMGVKDIVLAWDNDARREMMDASGLLETHGFRVVLFPFVNQFWKTHDMGDLLLEKDDKIIIEAELNEVFSRHSVKASLWSIT
jgi:hypothetical protein